MTIDNILEASAALSDLKTIVFDATTHGRDVHEWFFCKIDLITRSRIVGQQNDFTNLRRLIAKDAVGLNVRGDNRVREAIRHVIEENRRRMKVLGKIIFAHAANSNGHAITIIDPMWLIKQARRT